MNLRYCRDVPDVMAHQFLFTGRDMGGDMKPAHYVRGEGGEANRMYGYRGARGERPHVVWTIPLALTRVLIVVDSACAESDIYGYVGANGVFVLTNIPTERRFRPAESQDRPFVPSGVG